MLLIGDEFMYQHFEDSEDLSVLQEDCKHLNQITIDMAGCKNFAIAFEKKSASNVSYWRDNGTGPYYWISNLLTFMWREDRSAGKKHFNDFIFKLGCFLFLPFKWIPVRVFDYQDEDDVAQNSFVREFTQLTAALSDYQLQIIDSLNVNDSKDIRITEGDYKEIDQRCLKLISMALSCRRHVKYLYDKNK